MRVHDEQATAPVAVLRVRLVAIVLTALVLAVSACSSSEEVAGAPTVQATLRATAHATSACSGGFVAHDLPHLTNGPGDTASTFDGTGAGIAAGDLDGDGDLDLVIPNLSGPSTVAENVGDLNFVAHELIIGRFRGVALVDVDADDDLDIVMTTGIGPPVQFTNAGAGSLSDRFERGQIAGVRAATYAMAWSDLGGDGDLDLVTGSYNAELTILRNSPVLGSDTGVVLHEGGPDGFVVTRLSPTAQSLAMTIADIDADNRLDILVGNDLATADMIFLDTDEGWTEDTPFATTSYSTMSYDATDLDGDGDIEFFSTDMAPIPGSDPTRYREVDEDMAAAPRPDDIQTPENVLLERNADGGWVNVGRTLGIEATGWSWSGLFGDLDNDGAQDIYVVNGMRSEQLFDFLPDARLVEENQVFRNVGGDMVLMPEWGLADPAGGRGAVLGDFDSDGDLDIAINNLDEPSRMFENQLCAGSAVTVELAWPDSGNTRALGATINSSDTAGESPQRRMVTSTRGYLSAAPPVVHFGTGDQDTTDLTVRWPDGSVTELESVKTGHHYLIERTQ